MNKEKKLEKSHRDRKNNFGRKSKKRFELVAKEEIIAKSFQPQPTPTAPATAFKLFRKINLLQKVLKLSLLRHFIAILARYREKPQKP